jgi:hypothetical protein
MNQVTRLLSLCAGLLLAVWLAGCGPTASTVSQPAGEQVDHDDDHGDDHDNDHGDDQDHDTHADHQSHAEPKSLAQAITEVENLRNAIRDAFAADDEDQAHGPLHSVGHLLEELSTLAAEESLSEAEQQKVEQAVDSLMESYGAVDARLHGDEAAGKSYDEVAAEIDEALTKLKAIELPKDQS